MVKGETALCFLLSWTRFSSDGGNIISPEEAIQNETTLKINCCSVSCEFSFRSFKLWDKKNKTNQYDRCKIYFSKKHRFFFLLLLVFSASKVLSMTLRRKFTDRAGRVIRIRWNRVQYHSETTNTGLTVLGHLRAARQEEPNANDYNCSLNMFTACWRKRTWRLS